MKYVKQMYNILDFHVKCRMFDYSNTPIPEKGIRYPGMVKFDTGSSLTVFPAADIGLGGMSRNEFITWMQTNEKVNGLKAGKIYHKCLYGCKCQGIDSSAKEIQAFAYQVESLVLKFDNGDLDLGSVPIMISFDTRFKVPLLGIDLISLLKSEIDGENLQLVVSTTDAFDKLKSDGKDIDCIYMQKKGYYDGKLLRAGSLNAKSTKSKTEKPTKPTHRSNNNVGKVEQRVCYRLKDNRYKIQLDKEFYYFYEDEIQRDANKHPYIIVNGVVYYLKEPNTVKARK